MDYEVQPPKQLLQTLKFKAFPFELCFPKLTTPKSHKLWVQIGQWAWSQVLLSLNVTKRQINFGRMCAEVKQKRENERAPTESPCNCHSIKSKFSCKLLSPRRLTVDWPGRRGDLDTVQWTARREWGQTHSVDRLSPWIAIDRQTHCQRLLVTATLRAINLLLVLHHDRHRCLVTDQNYC